jgi:hypothetical protein
MCIRDRIITTARAAKAEPKTDPVNDKLDKIIDTLTALDRRLVKVETIQEERT